LGFEATALEGGFTAWKEEYPVETEPEKTTF
jgi:rhodanese-related sulfurtransferase